VNIPRNKTRQQGDPLHPSDPLSDEPMEWPSKTKAYIIDLVQIAGIQVPASDVQGLYNTADDINGLGSPIHGAPRMLRLGTTPYEFIPLIYDEVYGKWVSTTLYQAFQVTEPKTTTSTSFNDFATSLFPLVVIPNFLSAYNAGLRPQVAMGGYMEIDLVTTSGSSTATGECTVALKEFANHDTALNQIATGGSLLGRTQNTTVGNLLGYEGANWADFSFSATPAETYCVIVPQARVNVTNPGSGSLDVHALNVMIRYVADPV
jgi:hypothetical protein